MSGIILSDRIENDSGAKTDSEEALKNFEKGVEKENHGSMADAVEFYRKAYKLDANVDKLYGKKLIAEHQKYGPKDDKGQVTRLDEKKIKKINVTELLSSFANLSFEEKKPAVVEDDTVEDLEPLSPLVQFPDDIWIEIMQILAIHDTPSWLTLSLSCKKFAYLGLHNSDIWRQLSCLIYPRMNYDFEERQLNGLTDDQNTMVQLYDNDWKLMLNSRPFLKFNGLYISVVNYFREGGKAEGSISWTNPIRMITYYRYTRFYSNGEVLRLLTVKEPNSVVPHFNKNWKKEGVLEHVYRGFWQMSMDGIVTIESEGSVPKYQFVEELQIKDSGRLKHHKLHWIASYSVNKEDGDRGDFSLKNEKPFAFSRVKSYLEGV